MSQLETPVLLLIFNRPDTTRAMWDVLKRQRPTRLYIGTDGPRESIPNETATCDATRDIVTNIDWDCDVHTLFRDKNLGCKRAISSAIDWFFESEESGIIIEDDCVADDSFFSFVSSLLEKYRDDHRICVVSGNNHQNGITRNDADYYFSCFPHCWGWATWRRAWRYFDVEMTQWPSAKQAGSLRTIWPKALHRQYWERIFDSVYSGSIDSWAFIWTLNVWLQSALTILPRANLVRNIGFGSDATHTTKLGTRQESSSIEMPLRHPSSVFRDLAANEYSMAHHFDVTMVSQSKEWIKRGIKNSTGLDLGAIRQKIRARSDGR